MLQCLATDKKAVTPEVLAALDPLIEASATQVTWEALALELIARAQGHKPRERRWLGLASARHTASLHDETDPLFLSLTNRELGDYFEVTYQSRDEADMFRQRTQEKMRQQKSPRRPDVPAWRTPNVGVRTVPPFVGGLWSDLLQVTGCHPSRGFNVAADVMYRPDGRPARAAAGNNARVPDQCLRFAGVLFALLVAEDPSPQPATFSDVVVLWLQPEALTCGDGAYPVMVEHRRRLIAEYQAAIRAGATPKPGTYVRPKQIQDFIPFYTEEARKRRLEGDVIVHTWLTPQGCFSEASVAESPSPMLSGPALVSMMAGRYTPGTLDGQPIPYELLVRVHFTLPR